MADVGGGTIGAILGFVRGLFGAFKGKATFAVVQALMDLRKATVGIGEELTSFIGTLRSFLASAVGLLRRFWERSLLPLVRWLRERMLWLRDWLRRTFGPLMNFLLKVRRHLLEWYTKFVRPVLDAIEVARFILGTLSRLGVQWAAALDARLATIEATINENFRRVLGYITRAQNILDSIVTGELLFQRVPFLASLRRDTPFWVQMFWNSQVTGLDAATRARLGARQVPKDDSAKHGKVLSEFYRTGGGELAPVIAELVPLWQIAAGLKAAPTIQA